MRKTLTIALCATALTLCANTMAFDWHWGSKKSADTKATQKTAQDKKATKAKTATKVSLYAKPEMKAEVISKLPISADLVAIYRQGDWIKVGDRHDGKTGWININQYHQAKQDYYRKFFKEKTETVYFHSEKGKDGKISVTAYKNGKKLSDEQAKKMYHHLQQQEKQQWREMQRFNHFMNFPFMFMPGIIVIDHQEPTSHKTTKTKAQ